MERFRIFVAVFAQPGQFDQLEPVLSFVVLLVSRKIDGRFSLLSNKIYFKQHSLVLIITSFTSFSVKIIKSNFTRNNSIIKFSSIPSTIFSNRSFEKSISLPRLSN